MEVEESMMKVEEFMEFEQIKIFGVNISNLDQDTALSYMQKAALNPQNSSCFIFFVNSHTLNIAYKDSKYQNVLNSSTFTFGDGTGVRWGARLLGSEMKANLNGTDLVPQFLNQKRNYSLRVFLLGGEAQFIERAAIFLANNFPSIQIAGFHHGYFAEGDRDRVIQLINLSHPHLLLVGMGNPKQEIWIYNNRDKIRVPLTIGVGGLFHYWAGDLTRAPKYLRNLGMEWIGILLQQPYKWERYLQGNPRFLTRLVRYKFWQKENLSDSMGKES